MEFVEYPDRDLAAMQIANTLAGKLREFLARGETVSFAVPGGTTPGPIFDVLSAAELEWSRVTVMLTDERWVPEDNARSNAALVRSRLLRGPAAAAQFLPFYRQDMTVDAAAAALSETLKPQLPLSIVLLGMGEDMHTASLFPGAAGLEVALADDAPTLCAIATGAQPEPRITLSAPALNAAIEKHLIIFGDSKRSAFEKAMTQPAQEAPVRAVIQGGTVHWAA